VSSHLDLLSKVLGGYDISASPIAPGYAGRVPTAISLTELGRLGYLGRIDEQLAIYSAAMAAGSADMPGRRAIMERHADNPELRAIGALDEASGHLVGFAYGFRGVPGQWWHDVVMAGLTAVAGSAIARTWLDSALEIAEVHVLPHFQGRGIGRQMILMLTSGRPEHTAVLSTRDAPTAARHLYRKLGFADLLTEFEFPGGGPRYAVMGAPLPLPVARAGDDRPSPSS
jgi:ribosomal protein S18 acetylase RimI-like enzyme